MMYLLIALGVALLASWVWVIVLAMRRGTGWGAVAIFFSPIVALSLLVRQRQTAWKAALAHLLAFALFWAVALAMLRDVGRDFERLRPALFEAALERCTHKTQATAQQAQACRATIAANAPACDAQARSGWPRHGDLTLIGEATERYSACLRQNALPTS